MERQAPLLEMVGVSKAFPGVQALDEVSFQVRQGEVHAIVGENGAGKSTLMKIIAGVYHPDGGELRLRGRPVRFANPEHARRSGISIIFQEFNLVPYLSVAENLFLGREPRTQWGTIDWNAMRRQTLQAMELLDVNIDPDIWAEDLTVAQMQLVEILKALLLEADLVIMDEPTAALTPHEVNHLFERVRSLKAQNKTVIFISHRLEEVMRIADTITVFKDGKVVASMPASEMTRDDIVRYMVGRELTQTFPPRSTATESEPVLEVRRLSVGNQVKDVSFRVFRGEIVGIAGLEGHGQRELARAIFGAEPGAKGEVLLNGRPVSIRSPRSAIKSGVGFVSDDRKGEGLALQLSVRQNVALPNLGRWQRLLFVNRGRERWETEAAARSVDVRAPSLEVEVGSLSGGNQQKAVLAKWLPMSQSALIFSEPTRGIDVGAKVEIWRLMRQLADQGTAVLMTSSDLLEVIGVSDRVLVMHNGAIACEIPAAECTEEAVMRAATGSQENGNNGNSREERTGPGVAA